MKQYNQPTHCINYLALSIESLKMVFLKVSDGYETRKLQLTEELSLDQLKQQLSRFFPRLSENDFSLQYRDEDGDLITLSTDEELQAVLATLPQDAVWRVQLTENSETPDSLFDWLFEPHRRPFGLFSWAQPSQTTEGS